MKNEQLKPSPAEPERDPLCILLREIPQAEEKFSIEGPCFLTQDVHWVKNSSGEGVCRHE